MFETDVFAGIPDRELRLAGRRRTFDRGEVVFHRHDPGDGVHRVEVGHFAAKIITPIGETATVALYGAGEMFGLLAVVGGEDRRTATVTALEPGETLAVSTASFRTLRANHPQVGAATEKLLAAQLTDTSQRLVEALFMPATQRVHLRLADLARMYGRPGATPQTQIIIPLSQQHLADLSGTTRETVNRVLKAGAASGQLELSRNRIVIPDPARYLGS